ncbi:MAG: serine/threonine protein kinase [Flavobacteriia bacterium]
MSELSNKYKILSKLGNQVNSKFGEVFLIENRITGAKAVMKALMRTGSNQAAQERLKHEATFSFDLPGLPATIDLIETKNEIILIKSFHPGIPLDEFWFSIAKNERKEYLLKILEGLCKIFEHLAKLNIVHCDIKPGNILVDFKSGTLVVSLIDFGLALRTFEPNKRSTLFPLGFAAPELILNRLDLVDQRTDLYALGIVIWRLYDGKLPLTHPNPSVFTNLQLTHPLPESDKLPKGLHTLLQKLSAKHQFKTAPNLMDNPAVLAGLKEGMDQRYSELSVFIEEFRSLPKRQKWLLFNKGLF